MLSQNFIVRIQAKPIIDIAVGVSSFEKLMNYNDILQEHGIVYRGQDQPDQHLYVCGGLRFDNLKNDDSIHNRY